MVVLRLPFAAVNTNAAAGRREFTFDNRRIHGVFGLPFYFGFSLAAPVHVCTLLRFIALCAFVGAPAGSAGLGIIFVRLIPPPHFVEMLFAAQPAAFCAADLSVFIWFCHVFA